MTKEEKALAALDEVKQSRALVIFPEIVAKVISCDAASIRHQAAEDPAKLGFPVCRMGQTTVIPRTPFLRWLTGEVV